MVTHPDLAALKAALAAFPGEHVDWDMTPELAVTLYLEWGNNDWRSPHPPIRSRDEAVIYFVVDSWKEPPVARLVRRRIDAAEDLAVIPLPDALVRVFREEYGELKGVFEPLPPVKAWLRELVE